MLSAQLPVHLPTDAVRYTQQRFSTREGLPQNTITGICQTADGYLWVSTFGGLARFDGLRFVTFDLANTPELGSNRITTLFHARDDSLWLGTDDGGVIQRVHGGWRRLEPAAAGITAIAEDAHGRLWVGTKSGLAVLQDGVWLRPPAPLHELAASVNSIVATARGDLLVATDRGVWRGTVDGITAVATLSCTAVAETGDGSIWLGSHRGLWRLRAGVLEPFQPVAGATQRIYHLRVASDGSLWIAAAGAPIRIAPELLPGPVVTAPARSGQVAHLTFQDRDGGCWVGWDRLGLSLHCRAELTAMSNPQRTNRGSRTLLADGDDLLIGSSQGLFLRPHGEPASRRIVPEIRQAYSLLLQADRSVLVGSAGVVYCLDPTRNCATPLACDLPDGPIFAMARDGSGRLLLASSRGLLRLEGTHCTPLDLGRLEGEIPHLIYSEPGGMLWVGTTRALVVSSDDGTTWRRLQLGRDLPGGEVSCLFRADENTMWVGTYGGGLTRIRGEERVVLDQRHGLLDANLCSAQRIGDRLFCSSNTGLFLLRMHDLDAAAAGCPLRLPCRLLQPPAGFSGEGQGGCQPASVRTDDGRIWFCAIDGVLGFDPSLQLPTIAQPVAVVESIHAGYDRKPVGDDGLAPLGSRDLLFRFSAPSAVAGAQIRMRTRLVGHDPGWIDAGTARSARYAGLPAGKYRFEVQACGPDDHWDTVVTSAAATLPPYFYEQSWFLLFVGVLLLLGGFATAALLSRQGRRRARCLELEVERRTAQLARENSERQRVEVELRATQETLEERVQQRTEQLSDALRQLHADVAAREQLEKQVHQLQKLESIGGLAGGIAHDFNNLLTVVLGTGELLQRQLCKDRAGAAFDMVKSILDAGERGRRLTQQLLAFASRQTVQTQVIDLGKLAQDLGGMLRRLLGEDIALGVSTPASPVLVQANPTQIEQVLVNLCVNARDAMPHGGHLDIVIERLAAASPTTAERARIAVRDDGTGMQPEVRERAFEPFFTTKERAKGSGLGLSTCYGIVKQMGGSIEILSAPGAGTTVTLAVPLSTPDPEPNVELPAPAARIGHGRVLLIEDEDMVRATLKRMVERLGYSVVGAADGNGALATLRAEPDTFDLVLSDVMMPGLHGRDLVEALERVSPGIPVVFLTGYLDRQPAERLEQLGAQILFKPPNPAALTTALERAKARRRDRTVAGPAGLGAGAGSGARS